MQRPIPPEMVFGAIHLLVFGGLQDELRSVVVSLAPIGVCTLGLNSCNILGQDALTDEPCIWFTTVPVGRFDAVRLFVPAQLQPGHAAVLAPGVKHPDERHRSTPELRVSRPSLVGLAFIVVITWRALVEEGLASP